MLLMIYLIIEIIIETVKVIVTSNIVPFVKESKQDLTFLSSNNTEFLTVQGGKSVKAS